MVAGFGGDFSGDFSMVSVAVLLTLGVFSIFCKAAKIAEADALADSEVKGSFNSTL